LIEKLVSSLPAVLDVVIEVAIALAKAAALILFDAIASAERAGARSNT
jgi:hypothetical protein